MNFLDYRNSYIHFTVPPGEDKRVPGHKPWGNSVRILFDGRCKLTDEKTGSSEEFFLIAPCRTEWMYQDKGLFQMPNEEFCGIWSDSRHRLIKTGLTYGEKRDYSVPTTTDVFTQVSFSLCELPDARQLETDDDVVQATVSNLPVVAQTEFYDCASGLRVVTEYPVKTMNFHGERKRFQVDTGPVLFLDLALQAEHWIDHLAIAHVIYNTYDWAEFIIRCPTPVVVDGREVCSTEYYSEAKGLNVRNTLASGEVREP